MSTRCRCRLGTTVLVLALVLGACTSEPSPNSDRPATTPSSRSTKPEDREESPSGFADFTGFDLSEARSELLSAGHDRLEAVDATGEARLVEADGEWVVTAQSPPPRSTPDPAHLVRLFVVRKGETGKNPAALGYQPVPDLLYLGTGPAVDQLVALGLTKVTIDDFAGQGRLVPADETWTVTSQTPVAGSWAVPGDAVTLSALPVGEAAGDGS